MLSMYPHMQCVSNQDNYSMDNKRLSWTRKYNNNKFIIASRAYFQQEWPNKEDDHKDINDHGDENPMVSGKKRPHQDDGVGPSNNKKKK